MNVLYKLIYLTGSNEGASSSDSGECSSPSDTIVSEKAEVLHPEIIECSVESRSNSSEDHFPQNDNGIRIKLKYLNDDLKIVDGQLNELLGEFKRYMEFI